MTSTGWAGVIVVVLIIVGVGWYFVANNSTPAAVVTNTTVTDNNTATTTADMTASSTDQGMVDNGVTGTAKTVTVTYGNNGFSPASVTISKGDTVNFVAAAGADEMWIASDPHPVHSGYDGTTRTTHCAAGYAGPAPFDECSAGTSFSFTFGKVGTWGYHNHGNPADRGTVVVQ